MTGRRTARMTRTTALGVAAVLATALALQARAAHAYSFIEELPEDPCARARTFDPQDTTLAAQHARRACRMQAFEQRLAEERKRTVASQEDARDAWVEKWFTGTQPSRVQNPMAIELFAGSGIANYGLVFSWTVLRQLEVAGRYGQRQMSCASNQFSGTGGDCTRTIWNVGARYFLGDRDFAPFLGVGFSSTHAALAIVHVDQNSGGSAFLQGDGRSNSLSASAGLQLAVSYVRLSLEYVFEYLIYTGANLSDMQKTPSEDLRLVWEDSLNQDRHGVRFQVGFAF
jgi:opacity protein-like surface antigen